MSVFQKPSHVYVYFLWRMLPSSSCEASVTLVPKSNKGLYKKEKCYTKLTHESQTQYQNENTEQNIKKNPTIYEKDNTL